MKTILCIGCPQGCHVEVLEAANGVAQTRGNKCPKGQDYAIKELTCPVRTLIALVPVDGHVIPLSVKSSSPIPKEFILPCIKYIRTQSFTPPIPIGTVLISNILDTGADIIATREIRS